MKIEELNRIKKSNRKASRKYYWANRDKILSNQVRREKVREYNRRYYWENRRKILEERKIEYSTNPSMRILKIEKNKVWRERNPDKVRGYSRNWIKEERKKMRMLILNRYGNKCVCCGESIQEFLTIDHILNDGNIERKKFKSQDEYYRWIIKENFPDTLQILCMNCNFGKRMNKGVCPHRR